MDENIRSINYRRQYQITTSVQRRRALWRHLFGTAVLPVKEPFPHEVFYTDGSSKYIYILDSDRMMPMQLHRLAGHIQARTWGLSYEEALVRVRDGWSIDAQDCKLVAPSKRVKKHHAHSRGVRSYLRR